jgi:hypothetical protein
MRRGWLAARRRRRTGFIQLLLGTFGIHIVMVHWRVLNEAKEAK